MADTTAENVHQLLTPKDNANHGHHQFSAGAAFRPLGARAAQTMERLALARLRSSVRQASNTGRPLPASVSERSPPSIVAVIASRPLSDAARVVRLRQPEHRTLRGRAATLAAPAGNNARFGRRRQRPADRASGAADARRTHRYAGSICVLDTAHAPMPGTRTAVPLLVQLPPQTARQRSRHSLGMMRSRRAVGVCSARSLRQ
jgi:hypothetical protein